MTYFLMCMSTESRRVNVYHGSGPFNTNTVRLVGLIKLYVVSLRSVTDTRTAVAVVSSIFVTKRT